MVLSAPYMPYPIAWQSLLSFAWVVTSTSLTREVKLGDDPHRYRPTAKRVFVRPDWPAVVAESLTDPVDLVACPVVAVVQVGGDLLVTGGSKRGPSAACEKGSSVGGEDESFLCRQCGRGPSRLVVSRS